MKNLLAILLVTFIPVTATAQLFSASFKVSLIQPETTDVVVIREGVKIGFNRQDIIDEFQKFKEDYELNQYDLISFEKAIATINSSSEKIIINDLKERKQEHISISKLLYMRVAAGLLLAGKAEVIHNSSKVPEKEILWRQQLPDPAEGGLYNFTFTDESQFYVGRQYGVYIKEDVTEKETSIVDNKTQEIPKDDSNKVFFAVEIQGTHPNGIAEFSNYVATNIKYSKTMVHKGYEGNVFVKFIINTDGTLTEFTIMKGLDTEFDNEAIRVIKAGGPWKPGMQNGRIVRSQFVMPVRFKRPGK